jgi:cell fate regulator YaaT (PSP1 superfamily)
VAEEAQKYLVLTGFGAMRLQEIAQTEWSDLRPFTRVVEKTDRGTELGWVVTTPRRQTQAGQAFLPVWNGATRVLRRATEEDLQRQRELDGAVRDHSEKACATLIEQHKLPMRLVCAEHLLGGEKIFFYFISETRVDFRGLVRELARAFQTRIELRQIGPREAAKLVGDCQFCGQELCCRSFLRKLEPIPMSMARTQKQSLDPSKISGLCGKLKCCLRYEDQVYAELRRNLPEKGAAVQAGAARGLVQGTDLYRQRVTVTLEDGTQVTVPVSEIQVLPPGTEVVIQRPAESGDSGRMPREGLTGGPPESRRIGTPVRTVPPESSRSRPGPGAPPIKPETRDPRRPRESPPGPARLPSGHGPPAVPGGGAVASPAKPAEKAVGGPPGSPPFGKGGQRGSRPPERRNGDPNRRGLREDPPPSSAPPPGPAAPLGNGPT